MTRASELDLPPALRGVFFAGRWSSMKLWALDTPAEPARFDALAWHLELPVWSTVPGEPRFDLRPRDVLERPTISPRHWARIQNADLSRALEQFEQQRRWVIVDGYHRLARAALEGRRTLFVRHHPASRWSEVRVEL